MVATGRLLGNSHQFISFPARSSPFYFCCFSSSSSVILFLLTSPERSSFLFVEQEGHSVEESCQQSIPLPPDFLRSLRSFLGLINKGSSVYVEPTTIIEIHTLYETFTRDCFASRSTLSLIQKLPSQSPTGIPVIGIARRDIIVHYGHILLSLHTRSLTRSHLLKTAARQSGIENIPLPSQFPEDDTRFEIWHSFNFTHFHPTINNPHQWLQFQTSSVVRTPRQTAM